MKHPMQPIEMVNDVARFKENKIVRHLLDNGGITLNDLMLMGFSKDDHTQFNQLIGYSVSAFGDLSHVSKKAIKKADKKVEKIIKEKETARTIEINPTTRGVAMEDIYRGQIFDLDLKTGRASLARAKGDE